MRYGNCFPFTERKTKKKKMFDASLPWVFSEFTAADLTSMQFTLLSTFCHHLFTFTFEHLQIFNLHRSPLFTGAFSLSDRRKIWMENANQIWREKKPLQFVIMDTDTSERKMRHFNYKVNDDDIRRTKCHSFFSSLFKSIVIVVR